MALPYLLIRDTYKSADDLFACYASGLVRLVVGPEGAFLKDKGVPEKKVDNENAHVRLRQYENALRDKEIK